MSLINCPECGKNNVSDSAETCPECGYPIRQNMDIIIEKENLEKEEFVTICDKCCGFDIIKKEHINRICYSCGGKRISIMSRKDWFLMSEEEKNQTVDKYINQVKNSYTFDYNMFKEYHSRVRIDKDVIVYCPKCGNQSHAEYSIRENDTCSYCGTEYKYTQVLDNDFSKIIRNKNETTGKIYPECIHNYLWDNYLKNEPEFDRECMENRKNKISYDTQKRNEAYLKAQSRNKVVNNCPCCGSDNIQIIPRKWSLFTGFMTNKTDRVCVACKNKF